MWPVLVAAVVACVAAAVGVVAVVIVGICQDSGRERRRDVTRAPRPRRLVGYWLDKEKKRNGP